MLNQARETADRSSCWRGSWVTRNEKVMRKGVGEKGGEGGRQRAKGKRPEVKKRAEITSAADQIKMLGIPQAS